MRVVSVKRRVGSDFESGGLKERRDVESVWDRARESELVGAHSSLVPLLKEASKPPGSKGSLVNEESGEMDRSR